jgi:hypothetical protein
MINVDGSLSALQSLIRFSKYLGGLSLSYDVLLTTKKWTVCRILKNIKVLWFLFVLIFNIYVTNLLANEFKKRTFIVYVGAYIYLDIQLILLCCVIICDQIYEEVTKDILNKLIELRRLLRNDMSTTKKIAIFSTIIVNFSLQILEHADYYVMDMEVHLWHALLLFGNSFYTALVQSLTECRYLLMYLVIAGYFQKLNQDFLLLCGKSNERKRIVKMHQELCALSRETNKTFSLMLLFVMGYHVAAIVIQIVEVYNTIFLLKEELDVLDTFSISIEFLAAIAKLFCMIYVSNDCMSQVNQFNI